jgi:hypothetical protein
LPRADPAEQPDVRDIHPSITSTQLETYTGRITLFPRIKDRGPKLPEGEARYQNRLRALSLPGSAAAPVSERGGKKAGRRLERERVMSLLFSAVGVFSELSEAQG